MNASPSLSGYRTAGVVLEGFDEGKKVAFVFNADVTRPSVVYHEEWVNGVKMVSGETRRELWTRSNVEDQIAHFAHQKIRLYQVVIQQVSMVVQLAIANYKPNQQLAQAICSN